MNHGERLNVEQKLSRIEELVQITPEIVGLQNYEYFRNNNAEFKADVLAGNTLNPTIEYPELETGTIYVVADKAKEALTSLMPGEDSDKTSSLYLAIEYRYTEMFLVSLADKLRDQDLDDASRTELLDLFQETSEALYGRPEIHVFGSLAERNIEPLIQKTYAPGSVAEQISDELNQLVGRTRGDLYEPYSGNEETVSRIHDLVVERFGELVEHIDPETTYEVEGMVEALTVVLDKLGGHELGWQVVVTPNSSALSISAHQRLIEVGENRKPIKGDELRGKSLHECGVHALRSISAERAGWLSAAYGQEGYLPFEEALATALEDAYKGEFADHGVDYYLIAGLAYGLDGRDKRNFTEAFDVMWRVNALKSAPESGVLDDAQLNKAKSKSFTSCMRLFRGTQLHDKGVVYLKDLAYFNGQELAWSVLDNVHTQADFDLLLAGKLDLTRAGHVGIAKQILAT